MLTLAGCAGQGAGGGSESSIADNATKAVYDNDYVGLTDKMADSLKPQVTRAQVGVLSDKMHAMGEYQGVTQTSNDTVARRSRYTAKFAKGTMMIDMVLDANNKIIGYHVSEPASTK